MVKQIFICLTIGFLCGAIVSGFQIVTKVIYPQLTMRILANESFSFQYNLLNAENVCVGKLLIYNKLYRNLSQFAINCDKLR